MDVLLLCGYFESKYQAEINQKTKTWVENAANEFQKRLIDGLKSQNINLSVVSAPMFGPWPTVYKDIYFNCFQAGESNEDVTYVSFNNIWGYRNISRSASLKRQVRKFLKNSHSAQKTIIVYSAHTPYLAAAVYGKSLDPSVHIHMVVPDLPQYMNLSKKAHPIYDFFKKIDIRKIRKLNSWVDSYMLLTEYMVEKMEVGNRPYIIVEAIVDDAPEKLGNGHQSGKVVAYAGKLLESFGVKRLVKAFEMIDDPEVKLQICGGGELRHYIEDVAKQDKRITYHGVISAEKAHEILMNADVLVNPRLNDEEYTKYSFPSKNIEYLMTGNAVVAYMLDGMPEDYASLIVHPEDDSIEALAEAILKALNIQENAFEEKHNLISEYLSRKCACRRVAQEIIALMQK